MASYSVHGSRVLFYTDKIYIQIRYSVLDLAFAARSFKAELPKLRIAETPQPKRAATQDVVTVATRQ